MKLPTLCICAIVVSLLLGGCVSVNPQKDYDQVKALSKARTGHSIIWQQTETDKKHTQTQIQQLLTNGLTPTKAIRIALMNNRDLQAKFEMLGIARADVVQAGLFRNPSISALIRFPIANSAGVTAPEIGSLFTLSDLWIVPVRKKIASYDAQKITLHIVADIIKTAAETKTAYNAYLLQLALEKFTRKNIKLFQHELKTAKRHYGAGLINAISIYSLQTALYSQQLALARIKTDRKSAYAKLMRLIGLDPFGVNIKITSALPMTKPIKLTQQQAWKFAKQHRLDLSIARLQIKQTQYILKLQRAKIFGNVRLGVGYERELDRTQSLGPLLVLQIPIFNQNQAGIARAEYQLRQTKKQFNAKQLKAKEQILQLLNELKFERTHTKLYKNQILTIQRKAATFARKYVDTMQLNMFALIETQRHLLEAQKGYLMARYKYAQIKIKLDIALGRLYSK